MNDLLANILDAHGGMACWNRYEKDGGYNCERWRLLSA
jgi:hypothetical protein